ncbi:30S ribosomal protein S4 [Candidatus Woesebacteria bacterium]|nr:30S ribosomal protein S4 [Candidatus Woesebacteria bacterium]QQG47807.1 MAG: 30S ribosomal protein S4 [Candidatus Woesebacteria bacterium]
MRYTGPKDRLSRREGFDLFGKGTKLTRLNVTPGQHGPKGQLRQASQYGRQLREKQKVKRMYGLTEKQFRKYMQASLKTKGNTGKTLFKILESRLDNVVYRLKFADSRPQARQLVSHRHVSVNGKKVNIASYQVKPKDVINLDEKAIKIANIKKLIEDKGVEVPDWLKRKTGAGVIVRLPERDEIKEEINEQDIIEYYSR